MALSDLAARKAKATGKAYTLPDTDGLALAVTVNGGKSWHFRYYWNDRQKRMSFGTYPEVNLRDARALRDEARALLARGINPHKDRKWRRQAGRLEDQNTFSAVYDKWVKHRELILKEGRQTTLTQIRRVFGKDVLPFLSKSAMCEIRRDDLLDVVARIERRKAYSVAQKVRTWFNQMFRYALVIVPDLEVNPASDLDVVAVPQPPVRHNPFLRMNELLTLLQMLRTYPGMLQTQLGIRLLLLTGVRTGELRQATPDQFDLGRGLAVAAFIMMNGGGISRVRQAAMPPMRPLNRNGHVCGRPTYALRVMAARPVSACVFIIGTMLFRFPAGKCSGMNLAAYPTGDEVP